MKIHSRNSRPVRPPAPITKYEKHKRGMAESLNADYKPDTFSFT